MSKKSFLGGFLTGFGLTKIFSKSSSNHLPNPASEEDTPAWIYIISIIITLFIVFEIFKLRILHIVLITIVTFFTIVYFVNRKAAKDTLKDVRHYKNILINNQVDLIIMRDGFICHECKSIPKCREELFLYTTKKQKNNDDVIELELLIPFAYPNIQLNVFNNTYSHSVAFTFEEIEHLY